MIAGSCAFANAPSSTSAASAASWSSRAAASPRSRGKSSATKAQPRVSTRRRAAAFHSPTAASRFFSRAARISATAGVRARPRWRSWAQLLARSPRSAQGISAPPTLSAWGSSTPRSTSACATSTHRSRASAVGKSEQRCAPRFRRQSWPRGHIFDASKRLFAAFNGWSPPSSPSRSFVTSPAIDAATASAADRRRSSSAARFSAQAA
mmetsp:Transcript_16212/g.52897  ORF Transcript_16212/g.52897 Transcript_16212/m.52897 type:complete len:208 (-) Transcript_16212:236-859(-)